MKTALIAIAMVCGSAAVAGEEFSARYWGHTFAKDSLTPTLHNPASASFPWDTVRGEYERQATYKGTECRAYRVDGVFRANNAFGALVASTYSVLVLDADGTAVLASLSVNGKPVLTPNEDIVLMETDAERRQREHEDRLAREQYANYRANVDAIVRKQRLESIESLGSRDGSAMAAKVSPRRIGTANAKKIADREAKKKFQDADERTAYAEAFANALAR